MHVTKRSSNLRNNNPKSAFFIQIFLPKPGKSKKSTYKTHPTKKTFKNLKYIEWVVPNIELSCSTSNQHYYLFKVS